MGCVCQCSLLLRAAAGQHGWHAPRAAASATCTPACCPRFQHVAVRCPCPQVKTIDTPRVRTLAQAELKKRQAAVDAYEVAVRKGEAGAAFLASNGRVVLCGAVEARAGGAWLCCLISTWPDPCMRFACVCISCFARRPLLACRTLCASALLLLRAAVVCVAFRCLQAKRTRLRQRPLMPCALARAAARRTCLVSSCFATPCYCAALSLVHLHCWPAYCFLRCATAAAPGASAVLPSAVSSIVHCALAHAFCPGFHGLQMRRTCGGTSSWSRRSGRATRPCWVS